MLSSLHRLLARVRAVFTRPRLDRDLDDELALHLQLRAEALERAGLKPIAALRAAKLELGGVTQLREAHRAERGVPWIEVVVRDLRLAVRTLRRDAGFTTFALLVMGLGLGGTATVYCLVNALMLRPLPLADAGRLAWVGNDADDGAAVWHIQAHHLRDLQAQSRTFADLAGYYAYTKPDDLRVTTASGTERVSSVPVTHNFFNVLGVAPTLGRDFIAADAQAAGPDGPSLGLISHHLWQQRYGRDPGVAGRTIILNGLPSTIAGVLPASFDAAGSGVRGRWPDPGSRSRSACSIRDQPPPEVEKAVRAAPSRLGAESPSAGSKPAGPVQARELESISRFFENYLAELNLATRGSRRTFAESMRTASPPRSTRTEGPRRRATPRRG